MNTHLYSITIKMSIKNCSFSPLDIYPEKLNKLNYPMVLRGIIIYIDIASDKIKITI